MSCLRKEFHFDDRDFKFISEFVHKRIGIVLVEHKKDMVYARLVRRIRDLGLESFDQYCELLKNDEDELPILFNAITTNLTSFFREGYHFEHLANVIPEILEKQGSLRIWSAGCSTGCEPYTIAMVVKNIIENRDYDIKILATDIDTNALDVASNGVYSSEYFEKIPANYKKYASVKDGKMQVNQQLKSLIHFKRLNLLEPWPIKRKFDIIFCRNVVIYFDKQTQKDIFKRMYQHIHEHGFLYIGHSESLFKVNDDFELIGKTIYKVRSE